MPANTATGTAQQVHIKTLTIDGHECSATEDQTILDVCRKLKVPPGLFEILHEPDEKKSGDKAVRMIIEGKAADASRALPELDVELDRIIQSLASLALESPA